MQANLTIQNEELQTPLHIAVIKHTMPVVRILLANGAEIDETDLRGWTPLAYALGAAIHVLKDQNPNPYA